MPKPLAKLPTKAAAVKNLSKFAGLDLTKPIDQDAIDKLPPWLQPLVLSAGALVQIPIAAPAPVRKPAAKKPAVKAKK